MLHSYPIIAAPISNINGETKTGVTTFIDDKIDTGAIIQVQN
jgi:methionyl-tRNA formyltransferase